MKNPITMIACLLLPLLPLACGFHLKAPQKISSRLEPMAVVQLSPGDPSFLPLCIQLLQANHIQVISDKAGASTRLEIVNLQETKQLVSLTGGAQAGEYSLTLRIAIRVKHNQTEAVLLPLSVITVNRTYNSNATQMLSAAQQKERLLNEMNLQIAQEILQYLQKL